MKLQLGGESSSCDETHVANLRTQNQLKLVGADEGDSGTQARAYCICVLMLGLTAAIRNTNSSLWSCASRIQILSWRMLMESLLQMCAISDSRAHWSMSIWYINRSASPDTCQYCNDWLQRI